MSHERRESQFDGWYYKFTDESGPPMYFHEEKNAIISITDLGGAKYGTLAKLSVGPDDEIGGERETLNKALGKSELEAVRALVEEYDGA